MKKLITSLFLVAFIALFSCGVIIAKGPKHDGGDLPPDLPPPPAQPIDP